VCLPAGRRPARLGTKKPRVASEAAAPLPSIGRSEKLLVERLRHERDEAVELQAASAAVLKAISSSPGDLHSIFRVMLANALRICEAKFGHLLLYDVTRPTCMMFPDPIASTGLGRLAWSKQVIHQI
jgi:hypothetical protein